MINLLFPAVLIMVGLGGGVRQTPAPWPTITPLPPVGTPTKFIPSWPTSALDTSCGSGNPLGYGTLTPSAGWLAICGHCLPEPTITATYDVNLLATQIYSTPGTTLTPGTPTIIVTPTLTGGGSGATEIPDGAPNLTCPTGGVVTGCTGDGTKQITVNTYQSYSGGNMGGNSSSFSIALPSSMMGRYVYINVSGLITRRDTWENLYVYGQDWSVDRIGSNLFISRYGGVNNRGDNLNLNDSGSYIVNTFIDGHNLDETITNSPFITSDPIPGSFTWFDITIGGGTWDGTLTRTMTFVIGSTPSVFYTPTPSPSPTATGTPIPGKCQAIQTDAADVGSLPGLPDLISYGEVSCVYLREQVSNWNFGVLAAIRPYDSNFLGGGLYDMVQAILFWFLGLVPNVVQCFEPVTFLSADFAGLNVSLFLFADLTMAGWVFQRLTRK